MTPTDEIHYKAAKARLQDIEEAEAYERLVLKGLYHQVQEAKKELAGYLAKKLDAMAAIHRLENKYND